MFLSALYGAPEAVVALDKHRHHCFMKAVAKCPINTQLQLASLPPTSAAAKEHSMRVFHQVQNWLGNDLAASEWGWRLVNGQPHPILTQKAPAPDALLKLIFCNCTTGCARACGCRKAGIQCSQLCIQCCGGGCTNSEKVESIEGEEPMQDCDWDNHQDNDV